MGKLGFDKGIANESKEYVFDASLRIEREH
jgi:hypothetical protein